MTGPVVVVLVQAGVLSVSCTVTHDDGSTETTPVVALSMRGAQRELTSKLRHDGYRPVGRWVTSIDHVRSSRKFRETK